MKLTNEQKRGIEERFAVLEKHIKNGLDLRMGAPADERDYWWQHCCRDIEVCRDEVLVLVERLECESPGTLDYKTYSLLLDDLGDLVEELELPLGEMMNQSPRNVLRDCIEAVKELNIGLDANSER